MTSRKREGRLSFDGRTRVRRYRCDAVGVRTGPGGATLLATPAGNGLAVARQERTPWDAVDALRARVAARKSIDGVLPRGQKGVGSLVMSNSTPGQGSERGTGTSQESPRPGSASRCLEDAMEAIERELRQAVTYVNDAVIPQVRRESITAMRSLSESLRNLADRVERGQTPPRGPQS